MVSIIETVLLGIIQGLTEWLPVSSSGHLAVAKEFLDWQPPVLFYVLLHVGTLFIILAFFRNDIVKVLKAFRRRDFNSEDGKLGVFVVVGSIPTAIIGIVFKDLFESFFTDLLVVGVALLATGFLLIISERRMDGRALDYTDSFLIGVVQGIAIIPGISRSGATISTGLLRKVDKATAFKFSFLLSIPAIVGATVVEWSDMDLLVNSGDLLAVVVGVLASIVVGCFTLRFLHKVVMKQKLHLFSFYCWVAGVFIIILRILFQ